MAKASSWITGRRRAVVSVFGRGAWSGCYFFFSSRRRHTRFDCDWSSDVCSSDLTLAALVGAVLLVRDGMGRMMGRGRLPVRSSGRRAKDAGPLLAILLALWVIS